MDGAASKIGSLSPGASSDLVAMAQPRQRKLGHRLTDCTEQLVVEGRNQQPTLIFEGLQCDLKVFNQCIAALPRGSRLQLNIEGRLRCIRKRHHIGQLRNAFKTVGRRKPCTRIKSAQFPVAPGIPRTGRTRCAVDRVIVDHQQRPISHDA